MSSNLTSPTAASAPTCEQVGSAASASLSDTRPTTEALVASEVNTDTGSVQIPNETTLMEPPFAIKPALVVLSSEDFSNLAALRNPVPDLAAGQTLGRYRIESLLGRGGMGAVYRAYDSHLHRTVALKVPFFKRGHSDEVVKRFLREARAVAQLSHANLCRVFDVGTIDGVLFLTMEFVEGQSLEAIAQPNEPLMEKTAISIVMQVALALQEAHEHGIVHRDLKPANIMINGKGQAILMDFGLARNIDGDEHELTNDGDLLGTPSYMSPEQVRGESNQVGPASDIYSLGVVLYRLLAGRRPFEGKLTAILAAIPTQTPRPPREHNPRLAPELEAICLHAIAKSPSDRFGTAKELAEALAAFASLSSPNSMPSTGCGSASNEMSGSDSISTTVTDTRIKNQPTRRVPATVVVGVVVLAAFAVAAWKPWAGRPQESPAQTSLANGDSRTSSTNSLSVANAPSTVVAGLPLDSQEKPLLKNSPVVAADAKLEIHLQRAEQDTGFEVLGAKSLPLVKKDKLQLHIALSGPSYVYVLWIDTEGVCKCLWPETGELLDRDRQQPVRELWLPPESSAKSLKQKMFFLDDSVGLESIFVATSPKPLGVADLRPIETARVDLAHFDPGRKELVSFRSEIWRKAQPDYATLLLPTNSRRELVTLLNDQERGIGGVVETVKAANLPFDDFTKRLGDVFASYTGLVFPHE